MGRTSLTLIAMQLGILLFCYALGAIHFINLNFTLFQGTAFEQNISWSLDNLFASKENLEIFVRTVLIVMIVGIGGLLLLSAIRPGLISFSSNIDQIIFAGIVILEVAINLAMLQVYNALWNVSSLLALFSIGIFIMISFIIIIDWWRNPLT